MKENEDYFNHSFKNSENPEGMNMYQKAAYFKRYREAWSSRGRFNYRQVGLSGGLPEVELYLPGEPNKVFVSMVSNDYLGLSQHPDVKAAAQAGIDKYGAGVTASPAIGGQMDYHVAIENAIAGFHRRKAALLFTTGYTANSATMQTLFKKEDLAIVDAGVHASMREGLKNTNVKTFAHNRMDLLEMALKNYTGTKKYRSIVVVVDGVYSQTADLAPLDQIIPLCKKYGAYLAVDDAHGVGVIGQTGRGVIEHFNAWDDVDIITGTFSKTLGHLGGYVLAEPDVVEYLKFQAPQHIFSVAATPASVCLLTSIALVDEEPWRMARLWETTNYLKTGLAGLGFDTGASASAIVPVIIGSPNQNAEVCRLLLEGGVYANQIGYPAVGLNRAQIRMAVTALHTIEQMDKVLEVWEWVKVKMNIKNFE